MNQLWSAVPDSKSQPHPDGPHLGRQKNFHALTQTITKNARSASSEISVSGGLEEPSQASSVLESLRRPTRADRGAEDFDELAPAPKKKSRAADRPARFARCYSIGGRSTVSITWITPFEVSMSVFTTLALSTRTPSLALTEMDAP